MKNYSEFVSAGVKLMQDGAMIPLGYYDPIVWPPRKSDAPVALVMFAHADDECMSGMPVILNLMRQGYRVVVAPTVIGRPQQIPQRTKELANACKYIGAELFLMDEAGMWEDLRNGGDAGYAKCLPQVQACMEKFKPSIIVTHHGNDGHPDHKKTSRLVFEAVLKLQWNGGIILTEYWKDMSAPNVYLEMTLEDVVRVMEASSFHVGEMVRNPFHLNFLLLSLMNKQYSEVVLGWGVPAASFLGAVMLKILRCVNGEAIDIKEKRQVMAHQSLASFLGV